MAWRLAHSLEVLRSEVNELAPSRSRASDGTIGDPAHAGRASRHNPNDDGVVCALDLTNDVAGGCPIHAIARSIARHPHPELAYIISDGETAGRDSGWQWKPYYGENQHTKHAHFAVGVGPDSEPRPPYDSNQTWGILTPTNPAPEAEDDDMKASLWQIEGDPKVWCVAGDFQSRTHVPNPDSLAVHKLFGAGEVNVAKQANVKAWLNGLPISRSAPTLKEIIDGVTAALPDQQPGGITKADVEEAVRSVLGGLDN